jgi:hypothetical protein
MLEFALTAPLLLMLLLGLVEFGNGLNSYLTVVAAARDAARLGSQGGSDKTALLAMISNETARLPTTLDTTASTDCDPGPGVCIEGVSGSTPSSLTGPDSTPAVYVKICYDHPLLIGLPGIMDGPIRLCSQTTMRLVD